jgi:hypothetical protein
VRLGSKFKSAQNGDTTESDDRMMMKFNHSKKYTDVEHTNMLAMPKTEY